LRELPEEVRNEMQFVFAERVGQVLEALLPTLKPRARAEFGELVTAD